MAGALLEQHILHTVEVSKTLAFQGPVCQLRSNVQQQERDILKEQFFSACGRSALIFLLVRYYQHINPEMKPQQRVPAYYELSPVRKHRKLPSGFQHQCKSVPLSLLWPQSCSFALYIFIDIPNAGCLETEKFT